MNAIAKAFVQAQKEFGPALKTATNPHFRSKYADLSACVEAVIDALNNNGIALIQNNHPSDDGVIVETVFLHESGETLSCGQLHVPASKQDPQGYGSALTYARRYSLMAACGIAPEDDDGNAGAKSMQSKPQKDDKPIDTRAAEKALTDAVKKGTAELKTVWSGLDETVRLALKDKLAGWKVSAAEWDEQIATQA